MKNFTVNGKQYKSVPFDFNVMCEFEEHGVSIEESVNKPISMLRAYFAICAGLSLEDAGQELSKHIESGNNLDSISEALNAEIDESDFFQALTKGA